MSKGYSCDLIGDVDSDDFTSCMRKGKLPRVTKIVPAKKQKLTGIGKKIRKFRQKFRKKKKRRWYE